MADLGPRYLAAGGPGNEGQLPSEHIAQGRPFTVLANHFPVLIVLQWNCSRPITYEIIGGKSDVI